MALGKRPQGLVWKCTPGTMIEMEDWHVLKRTYKEVRNLSKHKRCSSALKDLRESERF